MYTIYYYPFQQPWIAANLPFLNLAAATWQNQWFAPTNDELIAWYDIGSAVTMANTDTVTLDFDGTNGFIQLT